MLVEKYRKIKYSTEAYLGFDLARWESELDNYLKENKVSKLLIEDEIVYINLNTILRNEQTIKYLSRENLLQELYYLKENLKLYGKSKQHVYSNLITSISQIIELRYLQSIKRERNYLFKTGLIIAFICS